MSRSVYLDPAAFERRVLQDAYLDGCAAFWLRRAEQLEAARPRPGDYHGNATAAELSARWRTLTAAAQACRHRAAFIDAAVTEFDDTLHALEQHPGAAA